MVRVCFVFFAIFVGREVLRIGVVRKASYACHFPPALIRPPRAGEGGMRGQGGSPDHRVQSRIPVRAFLPCEQDYGHPGAEDRGLPSTDRRNDPEGHAGVCARGSLCC